MRFYGLPLPSKLRWKFFLFNRLHCAESLAQNTRPLPWSKKISILTRGVRKVDIISLHVFSVHISHCAKMLPKADTEAIIQ